MEKPEPIFRLGKETPQEQTKRIAKSIAELEQNKATPQPSSLLPTPEPTPIFPAYSPKDRTAGIADFVKRNG
jgi:hypothetical protein